jgi:RNA polymerase sigma-70 factor (ECF subfamily)
MLLPILLAIESEEERSFVEELYNRYHQKMLTICMGILKNQADAEDAVTDTFVRIIDNLEKFTEVEKDKLPGLIAVCTKNVALNAYQKKSRQNEHETSTTVYNEEEEIATVDFADPDAEVEQAVLDGEFIQKVAELIRHLPEEQQSVVVLRYFYHYRNSEIAELMNLSRTAVDSKLFRAKNSLRKMLSEL